VAGAAKGQEAGFKLKLKGSIAEPEIRRQTTQEPEPVDDPIEASISTRKAEGAVNSVVKQAKTEEVGSFNLKLNGSLPKAEESTQAAEEEEVFDLALKEEGLAEEEAAHQL
jgi:hypothetical protein